MDDYKRFNEITKDELLALVAKEGKPENLKESQNDSPTVQEMIDLSDRFPSITFEGYVIGKRRDDWRVSVDGLTVYGLSAEEALEFSIEWRYADEINSHKDSDGLFSVRLWWD